MKPETDSGLIGKAPSPERDYNQAKQQEALLPGRSTSDHFLITRQQEAIEGQHKALAAKDAQIMDLRKLAEKAHYQISALEAELRAERSNYSGLLQRTERLRNAIRSLAEDHAVI